MNKRITIEVATGRGVAERWRSQYQHGDKWTDTVSGSSENTYKALIALGPNPAIAAVAEVLGKSWSYLSCSGCSDYVERAARFESYGDGILLCEACLKDGVAAISAPAREAALKKGK